MVRGRRLIQVVTVAPEEVPIDHVHVISITRCTRAYAHDLRFGVRTILPW